MVLYYQQPFGVSGDRTAIPIPSQSDGSLSYAIGFGPDYALPRDSNPSALPIERDQFNELIYDITNNLQQYQQHGVPEFITTSDNGGTAFQYAKYAVVRYNNGTETANYISKVATNNALPTVTANWAKIGLNVAYLDVAQTFTGIQTIGTAGTPLVLNSTNSTGLKITQQDNGTPRGGLGATSAWSTAFYLPDLATIAGGVDIGGNFLPGATATYDLGSTSLAWRNLIANRVTVLGSTLPTNGLYLPNTNELGIAANSVHSASFTSTGMNSTPIGATTPSTAAFTTATANSFVPASSTIPTNGLYLTAANTPSIAVNSALGVTFGVSSIGANATQRHTLPAVASDTIALLAATQTLTNKTLTSVASISFGGTGLANYQENAWTPVISFGGSAVGIAYATQTGTYTRIGNRIFWDATITLTSKGSSTGQAVVTGLPTVAASNANGDCGSYANFVGLTGVPMVLMTTGSSGINLSQFGATASSVLNNTQFSNTTSIFISGCYTV